MIVSILQLMGFPRGKPVHSRAEESPPKKTRQASSGTKAGTTDQGQPSAARRHEVKTQPAKSGKAPAPSAKPTAAAKSTPAPAPVKAAAKSVAKAPAKPAVKAPAKSAPVKSTPAKAPAAPAKAVAAPAKPSKPVAKASDSVPSASVASKPRAVSSPVPMPVTKAPSKTAAAAPAAASPAKSSFMPATVAPAEPISPTAAKKDPKLANNWKTKAPADLSDAELIAMPDSEYMNTVQLAAFRLKLVKLKSDILNSAGETTEHLREDTTIVPDPADRATIEEEHALELRTRDRERKLLKKIEQSIARIDAGDYGYCDETGEPIGVGRLLARPTATLSLEAQQRRELKQKMFGD